jgi:hypothetical protein
MYSIARCLSKHAIGKLSLVLHTFEKCFEKCFEKFAGHARYSFYIFMEVDGSEHFSGHYEDLCDPILVLHAAVRTANHPPPRRTATVQQMAAHCVRLELKTHAANASAKHAHKTLPQAARRAETQETLPRSHTDKQPAPATRKHGGIHGVQARGAWLSSSTTCASTTPMMAPQALSELRSMPYRFGFPDRSPHQGQTNHTVSPSAVSPTWSPRTRIGSENQPSTHASMSSDSHRSQSTVLQLGAENLIWAPVVPYPGHCSVADS